MRITKHARIYGLVQGVFFRESMAQKARQLGIDGWVRNRLDGSVEAMLQGSPQAVDTILQWAQRGPDTARVERVEIEEGDGNYFEFKKLRSE